MSSKTRRPNVLDKLVTKRDLLHVITAMNQATRALEQRLEALEDRTWQDMSRVLVQETANETPT